MHKKKVLLLDTAFASMPIYRYLVKHFDVWVMGNRENDALVLIKPDRWIRQDYSQVDIVQSYVKKMEIDYVVPGCTDVSIETALRLEVADCVFDTVQSYDKLGNKALFRALCKELALPAPQSYSMEDFPIDGMVICKPVDGFSGRGVTVIEGNNVTKVAEAYEKAQKQSPTSSAIIEQYVNGQLYSYSAFIENQKVIKAFVVKEGSSVNSYAVDTSFVDSDFSVELKKILLQSTEKMASSLNLRDGLLHIQFIKEDDQVYLIEVSRRHPGDLYGLLIEYSTGFQYSAKYASYFVKQTLNTAEVKKDNIIRHTLASKEEETFYALRYLSPLDTIAFFPLLQLGSTIQPNQHTRVGILFTKSDTKATMLEEYEAFLQRKVYNYALNSKES